MSVKRRLCRRTCHGCSCPVTSAVTAHTAPARPDPQTLPYISTERRVHTEYDLTRECMTSQQSCKGQSMRCISHMLLDVRRGQNAWQCDDPWSTLQCMCRVAEQAERCTGCRRPDRASAMPSACFCLSFTRVTYTCDQALSAAQPRMTCIAALLHMRNLRRRAEQHGIALRPGPCDSSLM